MPENKAHIIIIDGAKDSGRKTLCFELALALLYSNQKTALLLDNDSPLIESLNHRKQLYPNLITPEIINKDNFSIAQKQYNAIIVLKSDKTTELELYASTYITILQKSAQELKKFQNNKQYFNNLWELKKKIAGQEKHSLNWVVCENNIKNNTLKQNPHPLANFAKLYGFRIAPTISHRKTYKTAQNIISAQDKTTSLYQKSLTYEDICTKREIERLAEFIFNA